MATTQQLRDFLSKPRTARQQLLDKYVPMMPKGFEDWTYWDCPGSMPRDLWPFFLAILGEKNYKVLAQTIKPNTARGQLFISPAGMANMRALIAAKVS